MMGAHPLTSRNSEGVMEKLLIVNDTVPVFVTVTLLPSLITPAAVLGKVSDEGETVYDT